MLQKEIYQPTTAYKLIYIFRIIDTAHEGLLKIGEASVITTKAPEELSENCSTLNQAAKIRINSYTNTAGTQYQLLHTELAVIITPLSDGRERLTDFKDKNVHKVLKNSGVRRVIPDGTNANEWYEVDLQTAKNAIKAVKAGRTTLNATEITPKDEIEIVLREEQDDAIQKTIECFKTGSQMLWNAKMRYGKTITALSFVKREIDKYQKTLIITHRPVVESGWKEDYKLVFRNNECTFVAKTHETEDVEESARIDYANERQLHDLCKSGKPFIYFASIQDLRGSKKVGGRFDKNNAVFNMQWDLVINDEAHEGTQTELGQKVATLVKRPSTKLLSLSGTPFNIINQYDDDSVYTWDYVMEQEHKRNWDTLHPGDPNPYAELPQMHIYTYDLGEVISGYAALDLEGKAFNFAEFFRTWNGNPERDGKTIPAGASIGDFIHEKDVEKFLNLITTKSNDSTYPFATEEYRNMFRHTLWMVPGVKEAKALSKMLRTHPIFSNFGVANVAGEGDAYEETNTNDALQLVKDTIGNNEYSITLSCGKLTTGVTIREWTAVFMLAGSYSTAAAGYLQTIFRVQSPGSINGKPKEHCYVFDFAPDRTLKVLAEAAKVSRKGGSGGTSQDEKNRDSIRNFLNFCPVVSIAGTQMQPYSVETMMEHLKRAYADKAIRTGFDDSSLYNERLMTLDNLDIKDFEKLKGVIGTTRAMERVNDVVINEHGFTEEEYEQAQFLKKKHKRQFTEEEKALLELRKKQKQERNNAISILRGISVRMPLLIYGADVPFEDDITIEQFVELIDNASWNEFMPKGVTKAFFNKFLKYYDRDVFVAAGREIRRMAKLTDTMLPTERVQNITKLFSYFKNPDKETVLTPWRVVNMHMGDCLGGYEFWDEKHDTVVEEPRFVDRGEVTTDTLVNPNAKVLEINSKTGLYPLYVAYSIYRAKCKAYADEKQTADLQQKLWDETIKQNIFVICKTPMAKAITKRSLTGYRTIPSNTHYFDDLINQLRSKPEKFVKKVLKPSYWDLEGANDMKFDAIVGNPPYQEMDGGNRNSSSPVYQLFVSHAKSIEPRYISMITPSRWFAGGKGLEDFRAEMLADRRLKKIVDFADSTECFKGVDIAGGISYFLWDRDYSGTCEVVSIRGESIITLHRKLDEYDIFIRNNSSVNLLQRITTSNDNKMEQYVFARNVFGITTNEHGQKVRDGANPLTLACSQKGNQLDIAYVGYDKVSKGHELLEKYKVVIGRSVPRNGEVGVDPKVGYRAITTVHVFGPDVVFTDTYLLLSYFDTLTEAENFAKYMTLKLPRFLLHETYTSMAISRENFRFVPYLDYSKEWTDEMLYERYECTKQEIEMIESLMRPLEYVIH